jgi:hypothetical protein
MKIEEIESILDIATYSVEKNLNNQADDIIFEAEIFTNKKERDKLFFDFWDTQMPLLGRNQLPSSSSQYIYFFKVVKVDSKNLSVGIVFPLDFESTVTKVERSNGNIKFYVKKAAIFHSYNRNHKKYGGNVFSNFNINLLTPANTNSIIPLMDSQSPDHPKTSISGSVWG